MIYETHSGIFHCDEVCGWVIVKMVYPAATLQRVNHQARSLPKQGKIIADRGGVYNPASGQYDHHQDGSLPASNYLLWQDFGARVVQTVIPTANAPQQRAVALRVQRSLMLPISDWDTNRDGFIDRVSGAFTISQMVSGFNGENPMAHGVQEVRFMEAARVVERVLRNEIEKQWRVIQSDVVWEQREVFFTGVYILRQYCENWRQNLKALQGRAVIMPQYDGAWIICSWDGEKYPTPKLAWAQSVGLPCTFSHAGKWLSVFANKEAALEAAEMWYV